MRISTTGMESTWKPGFSTSANRQHPEGFSQPAKWLDVGHFIIIILLCPRVLPLAFNW